MACPGSMCLGNQYEDKTSVYAEEGTLAHAIAEFRARKRYTTDLKPSEYEAKLAELQSDPLYDPEMMECTDAYLELIDSILVEHKNPTVLLEQQLDYSDYVPARFGFAIVNADGSWEWDIPGVARMPKGAEAFVSISSAHPDKQFKVEKVQGNKVIGRGTPHFDLHLSFAQGFGTGDCIIFSNNRVDVVDYKHGKGVKVEVVENPQLRIYGLAAASKRFLPDCSIDTVGMHICQPRNGGNSSWLSAKADLEDWGNYVLMPAARKAFVAYLTPKELLPDSELCAGEHCKFCKAKAVCRTRGEAVAVEVFGKKNAHTYRDDELSEICKRAKAYIDWANDVQSYCLKRAMEGDPVPGFKVVHGRGSRTFRDPDTAIQALQMLGYDPEQFYERKPLTVAQAEKIVGKKTFSMLGETLFSTMPGKPTLVPDTDSRQAITGAEVFMK